MYTYTSVILLNVRPFAIFQPHRERNIAMGDKSLKFARVRVYLCTRPVSCLFEQT